VVALSAASLTFASKALIKSTPLSNAEVGIPPNLSQDGRSRKKEGLQLAACLLQVCRGKLNKQEKEEEKNEVRKENDDVWYCVLLPQNLPEAIARTIAERIGSDPKLWKLAQVSNEICHVCY
jgi:hypothetical protein